MKYTGEYIADFRAACDRLHLKGADLIASLSDEQIIADVNGIGSASMPAALRRALDSLHPSLVYASHIHDLAWTYRRESTWKYFRESNADFESNGIIIAKDRYSWWDPRRWLAIRSAKNLRAILDQWGYDNFLKTKTKTV